MRATAVARGAHTSAERTRATAAARIAAISAASTRATAAARAAAIGAGSTQAIAAARNAAGSADRTAPNICKTMTAPDPDLLLITGIPGTGKTSYGDRFASEFGFVHRDIEDPATAQELCTNPNFIEDLTVQNTIVTWGFDPQDAVSLNFIRQFRQAGFKLIWFDGNREAALREFEARAKSESSSMAEYYLRMHEFYQQLYRIEASRIIETLRPVVVDSFDSQGQFKSAADLLEEISQL